MWGLQLLRTASAGFKAVAAWFAVLASHAKIERAPTAETLIQWELKLGLLKLMRQKAIDQEWIWLADHVIRLGAFKCFVIVGVRVASLRERGDLTITLEDLEPMAIIPMQVSNGEQVAQKLEATIKKLNIIPSACVIDHGPDLYSGAKIVAKNHPGMHLKYDVCHKVASELKRRLQTDSWLKMTRCATETKKALSLTPYMKFAPPAQRSKARYMNLDSLVTWGNTILKQYDQLPTKVQEKTKWLHSLTKELALWKEWLQIGQITRDVIRKEGFYEGVEDKVMDRIIALNLSEASEELTQSLINYISEESEGISYERRMVGSTEALEGLFGGYKRAVGENKMSVNGLGRLILCMSSRIGEFSEEVVHEAMTNIRCKDVDAWLHRAFAYELDALEEKQEQSVQASVCNF
jgi:hypothetical protein